MQVALEVEAKPRWHNWVGWTAAVLMAILWLVAGIWKLTDLSGFQVKLTQLLVPVSLSLPATLALAVSEVFAGVLLLVPAWRRWGGYFSAALLLVFMAYVGINYATLQGEDCSCFPWLERAVGPAFFWSDAGMVALALVAAWFSPRPARLKGAAYALASVAALGFVMLGVDQLRPAAAAEVPEKIAVDGGEFSLHDGRVFVYFFNPTCLHCLDAGIAMSELEWDAQFVGVPTQDYDFGPGFVEDTGLKNVTLSPDLEPLKEVFPFEDVPYAAAIENGQVRERLMFFEEPELSEKLRELGFVK